MQILFPEPLLTHNFEIIILQKPPIQYISHGQFETGGYKLETALCEALGGASEVRFRRNFKGIFGWFSLAIKAFFNAKSDVVITVSRLAWPVYARQLFSKRKMVVVLHNLDETDGKPKLYFYLLKLFIQKAAKKTNKIAIICVADFWKNTLETKYKFENNIFVFPNLFSTPKYQFHADVVKKNESLIHLGQYSEKADIYSLSMVAWEIFTGKCPFEGMSQTEVIIAVAQHNYRPPIPSWCNKQLTDFLTVTIKYYYAILLYIVRRKAGMLILW